MLRKVLVAWVGGLLAWGSPALAAPHESAYGAEQGYPPANRSNWYRNENLVWTYSHYDELFPTRTVAAGGTVRALPRHPVQPDWPFIEQYLDTHPASGLMILKDGKVVVERYQYGRGPETRFTTASMAKTVVSMALGMAVGEGKIASIDDPVDRYEPALAQTAWKGIAIRHVLNMSSGVRFDETYDNPQADIARFSRNWTMQSGSLLLGLSAFQAHDAAPGDRFKYVSADTQVLAQVLVKAVGMSLSDYVSQKLWQPMGAEADGAWVLDATGMEAAYCCLSARLRDWARLALLMMDGGQRDGRSIIPAEWVEAATTVRLRDGHLQPRRATPFMGYGYQTWIFPDQMGFALQGVRGQAVFVHPRLKLVMVQTGVWPRSTESALGRQRIELWLELLRRAASL